MSVKAAVFCPNPGVDRVYCLGAGLTAGELHRAESVRVCPGSKGANLAIALQREGVPVMVFTFSGGGAAETAEKFITDCGAAVVRVPCAAGVRENIKLVEPDGKSTEINEKGGPICEKEAEELLSLVKKGGYDALFLCGSLPQGVKNDYFATAIAAAKRCGAVTFLDSSGAALAAGVAAKPDYIKPNAEELAELTGGKVPKTRKEAAEIAVKWQKEHPETAVICTLGKEGAVYAGREGVFEAEAKPWETPRSAVGAGDAFFAGFGAAILHGATPEKALAAGCATCNSGFAGGADRLARGFGYAPQTNALADENHLRWG